MSELAAQRSPSAIAVSGELIDPRGLAARAAEVAARQRSPETRRTYAAVYRSFAAFVGPQATAEAVTPEAVRASRPKPAKLASNLALRALVQDDLRQRSPSRPTAERVRLRLRRQLGDAGRSARPTTGDAARRCIGPAARLLPPA